MSTRMLPDWLTSYLAYTEKDEPPTSFKLWTALSVIASVLQRKCYLQWGRRITIYPNMYVVLVGPSGKCRKGAAMGPGYTLLRKLGVKMSAEAITREALIRELKEATDTSVDPSSGRIVTHTSLTVHSQELAVFLGYNNIQLMSDLTDWYDCKNQWTYRTKHMGTDDIQSVWVNLLGAITPDILHSILPQEAIGGGLTARMVFLYETEKGKLYTEPYVEVEGELELEEMLLHDLESISTTYGAHAIDESFKEIWRVWYPAQEAHPVTSNARFGGYISRRQIHVLKLCMILNASRDGGKLLTEQDLGRAIRILEDAETRMFSTFEGIGKNPQAEVMAKVITMIAERGVVTMVDLLDAFSFDASKDDLMTIVGTISARGICDVRQDGTGTMKIVYRERR